jgi:hypothetical protein
MTEKEYADWKAVTESSRFRWVEDEIYRLNGRGAFYYSGGEDGVYMRIEKDGLLEAGRYKGAIPHIGEAAFTPQIEKQYADFNAAYTAALEAGGKQFLLDMLSPQNIEFTQEDALEETTSIGDLHTSPDFQCDLTSGYPTVLVWDQNKDTAILQPAPAYDDDSELSRQCVRECAEWGVHLCRSWKDYNALLESIGEEAYENGAVPPDDDEAEEYGGIQLS